MKKELEEEKNIKEEADGKEKNNWKDICFIPAVVLILLSGIDILRFAILGDKTAFITFSLIAVVFILVAYTARKSRIPVLYLVIAVAAFVLYFNTNFSTSTYYFQLAVSGGSRCGSTWWNSGDCGNNQGQNSDR